MATSIDVETLRRWLDQGRPVTVLDLRTDGDRRQWSIPGSLHVNAYDALRAGSAGALADVSVPSGHPIVTVCAAGGVSQLAADLLAVRGLDARSLAGGMNAWSLAWNTADVPLGDPSVHVVQVRRTGKGCLSYVVASHGDAAVIDPSLAPDIYLHLAAERGWRIRSVLETHIHADHVSRARMLAEQAGATLYLPDQRRVRFSFAPVHDGDRIGIGRATLTARRTPGHTAESTSYVLDGAAAFTGDTLFIKGVGRPDLHADVAGTRERARTLFASLTWLDGLAPETVVLPGHTGEPIAFDGRPIAAPLAVVHTWLAAWLASEAEFVARVLAHLPETPPNFSRIVALNEAGDTPDDLTTLEAGANRCAVA